MHKNRLKGIGILFLTSALYGLYGIYSRLIALQFEVFTQNWIRNTFVLVACLLLIFFLKHKWKKVKRKDALWITAWILCDVLFVITLFIAFNNLTIGTTLFLLYSGITIAGYLAGSFLLKEKLTPLKLAAITSSVIGLLIIYGGQIHTTDILFLILGFMSGMIGGLWFVLPKLISEEYPRLQLIAMDAGGILVVNLFLAYFYNEAIPEFSVSLAWLGVLLYGTTQLIGDLLIIRGFRLVEAHVGSLILPLEAVFGVLFAYVFFHEVLPTTILLGGFFILMGAIIPNLQKERVS